MGVNTKAWGPSAWKFLHGFALAVDTARRRLRPTARKALEKDARELLKMLKDVLPCIHCRRSYGTFITMEPTVVDRITMTGPKGFEFTWFMYLMHERVNNKLFWQDAKKMADRKEFMDKWYCYQPAFETVIAKTDPPNTREFQIALCHFVFYVLHDFDAAKEPKRTSDIVRFMYKLTDITLRLNLRVGHVMNDVLLVHPLRTRSTLRERVCVWNRVQAKLLGVDSVYCMSVDDRLEVCDKAVVKC